MRKAILGKDSENIVGLEMEAYALASATLNQQLHSANVVFGVFKSVADYCSTVDELDEATRTSLSKLVDFGKISPPYNPTKNKELKAALQFEATKLSFELASCILEDLVLLHGD